LGYQLDFLSPFEAGPTRFSISIFPTMLFDQDNVPSMDFFLWAKSDFPSISPLLRPRKQLSTTIE
jgi:hypothetical protein